MVGIVILNYSAWEDVRRCVASIYETTSLKDCTIILVDNASDCEPNYNLEGFLRKYHILFIKSKKNRGYNAGNNIGIAKALEIGCSQILISNSDVRYFSKSIFYMKQYLQDHPQVGIVGPKILDSRGTVQKSNLCRRTGMKEKYLVRTRANAVFRNSYRTYFGCDRDYEESFEVYAVLGCCFMMSEACARAVAPLDEYPFLYEEELILGIRMAEAGFRTVYYPKAVIEHLHGNSTKRRESFAFAHFVRSEIYYCRAYLHAAKWQIYPLYFYRVVQYFARCMKKRDFCRNLRYFFHITGRELQML